MDLIGARAKAKRWSPTGVIAFKQAGGYNNDWDMWYLQQPFAQRGYANGKVPLAERSIEAWAALSEPPTREHGVIEWIRGIMPATAQLDYNMIGDLPRILLGCCEMKNALVTHSLLA
jgi:hypothetical protein